MKKLMSLLMVAMVFATISTAQAQVLDDTAVNLSFSGRLNLAKGVAIAHVTNTVDLNSVAGNLVHTTGTSTITNFGTASQAGICRRVIFDSALSMMYNASVLVIPGSVSISVSAGDSALVCADTVSKWIVLQYTRRSVSP